MSETMKINISNITSSSRKDSKSVSLDGYVEIDREYLYFFKNTWIKYTDKQSFVSYSGGNLSAIEGSTVVLKNIRGDIFELEKENYIFYCKDSTEQYKAFQQILIEREKLDVERRKLREERNLFIRQKRDFFAKYNIK